jgi:hypothetical protein
MIQGLVNITGAAEITAQNLMHNFYLLGDHVSLLAADSTLINGLATHIGFQTAVSDMLAADVDTFVANLASAIYMQADFLERLMESDTDLGDLFDGFQNNDVFLDNLVVAMGSSFDFMDAFVSHLETNGETFFDALKNDVFRAYFSLPISTWEISDTEVGPDAAVYKLWDTGEPALTGTDATKYIGITFGLGDGVSTLRLLVSRNSAFPTAKLPTDPSFDPEIDVLRFTYGGGGTDAGAFFQAAEGYLLLNISSLEWNGNSILYFKLVDSTGNAIKAGLTYGRVAFDYTLHASQVTASLQTTDRAMLDFSTVTIGKQSEWEHLVGKDLQPEYSQYWNGTTGHIEWPANLKVMFGPCLLSDCGASGAGVYNGLPAYTLPNPVYLADGCEIIGHGNPVIVKASATAKFRTYNYQAVNVVAALGLMYVTNVIDAATYFRAGQWVHLSGLDEIYKVVDVGATTVTFDRSLSDTQSGLTLTVMPRIYMRGFTYDGRGGVLVGQGSYLDAGGAFASWDFLAQSEIDVDIINCKAYGGGAVVHGKAYGVKYRYISQCFAQDYGGAISGGTQIEATAEHCGAGTAGGAFAWVHSSRLTAFSTSNPFHQCNTPISLRDETSHRFYRDQVVEGDHSVLGDATVAGTLGVTDEATFGVGIKVTNDVYFITMQRYVKELLFIEDKYIPRVLNGFLVDGYSDAAHVKVYAGDAIIDGLYINKGFKRTWRRVGTVLTVDEQGHGHTTGDVIFIQGADSTVTAAYTDGASKTVNVIDSDSFSITVTDTGVSTGYISYARVLALGTAPTGQDRALDVLSVTSANTLVLTAGVNNSATPDMPEIASTGYRPIAIIHRDAYQSIGGGVLNGPLQLRNFAGAGVYVQEYGTGAPTTQSTKAFRNRTKLSLQAFALPAVGFSFSHPIWVANDGDGTPNPLVLCTSPDDCYDDNYQLGHWFQVDASTPSYFNVRRVDIEDCRKQGCTVDYVGRDLLATDPQVVVQQWYWKLDTAVHSIPAQLDSTSFKFLMSGATITVHEGNYYATSVNLVSVSPGTAFTNLDIVFKTGVHMYTTGATGSYIFQLPASGNISDNIKLLGPAILHENGAVPSGSNALILVDSAVNVTIDGPTLMARRAPGIRIGAGVYHCYINVHDGITHQWGAEPGAPQSTPVNVTQRSRAELIVINGSARYVHGRYGRYVLGEGQSPRIQAGSGSGGWQSGSAFNSLLLTYLPVSGNYTNVTGYLHRYESSAFGYNTYLWLITRIVNNAGGMVVYGLQLSKGSYTTNGIPDTWSPVTDPSAALETIGPSSTVSYRYDLVLTGVDPVGNNFPWRAFT